MNETHESSVCNILRYFYTIFKPIYQNVSSVCSYVVLYLRANSIFLNADTPNTKNDWNALMVRKGRMEGAKRYLTVSVFRRYGNRTRLCMISGLAQSAGRVDAYSYSVSFASEIELPRFPLDSSRINTTLTASYCSQFSSSLS